MYWFIINFPRSVEITTAVIAEAFVKNVSQEVYGTHVSASCFLLLIATAAVLKVLRE